MRFDDAPERFRSGGRGAGWGDSFSGASGVLFEQAMAQTRMAICLSDPHAPDMPIVFANRAFRQLTGYSEEEIVGFNCRFLQGPKTDPEPVARIREAIVNEDVVVVELLNYRKTFWNALHLGPIYNDAGELVYFFGSQWDVSDVRAARAEEQHAKEMARELSHRMKNMFAVISGIADVDAITLALAQQARGGLDPEVATRGILLAALTNTAMKGLYAALVGGLVLARWASAILAATALATAATLLL